MVIDCHSKIDGSTASNACHDDYCWDVMRLGGTGAWRGGIGTRGIGGCEGGTVTKAASWQGDNVGVTMGDKAMV